MPSSLKLPLRGIVNSRVSAPGMEFFMDTLQPVLIYMGVNLGSSDVCMAEHHLHRPEVCAVAEKMGGKRMADHMGRDIFGDAGSQSVFANNLPEAQAGHAGAASGNKEKVAPLALQNQGAGGFQVVFDPFFRLVAKGNQSFFVALADDPDKTCIEITCRQWQPDQLGNPQSGGIEEKEHGVVPAGYGGLDGGRRQQAPDLLFRQCLGQGPAAFRQVDRGKGILFHQVLPNQEIEKGFQ